jgi:hypothetical protein
MLLPELGEWSMKRVVATVCAGVLLTAGVQIGVASSASAAPTKFTSCASMYKYYKHGISKNKKAQKRAVKAGMYKPAVKPAVYRDSYKTLDRDKDGTMCEVPR